MTAELRAARAARGLPPYRHEGAPRHPGTQPCETDACPLPALDYGTRCWRCSLRRERENRARQLQRARLRDPEGAQARGRAYYAKTAERQRENARKKYERKRGAR